MDSKIENLLFVLGFQRETNQLQYYSSYSEWASEYVIDFEVSYSKNNLFVCRGEWNRYYILDYINCEVRICTEKNLMKYCG